MKLVGKFTEIQCEKGEDREACAKVEKESNGSLRYFISKLRRRKGKEYLEVWAMTLDEYSRSSEL